MNALQDLLRSIDFTKTRIERQPAFLAVFGGELSKDEKGEPKSQRDEFVKDIRNNHPDLKDRLLVPESYEDWNDFDTYSDLLQFERDLGYITGAVIIFLEAPGSIAELGAFSQIDSLRENLIVVVPESRHPKKSFISLGPLRQLQNADSRSVCVVPNHNNKRLNEDIFVVLEHVNSRFEKEPEKQRLKEKFRRHEIILTLDLISLAEVITMTELHSALQVFNLEATQRSVQQSLFTLTKTGLVSSRTYGGTTYYHPMLPAKTWADYDACEGAENFQRARWQARIRKELHGNQKLKRVWELHHGKELFA